MLALKPARGAYLKANSIQKLLAVRGTSEKITECDDGEIMTKYGSKTQNWNLRFPKKESDSGK